MLGFSHPDNVQNSLAKGDSYGLTPGQNVFASNLQNGKRMDDTNCMRPWDYVVPGTPPNDPSVPVDGPEASRVRPSIMKALTQHNPRVCLSQDDLEGLNVLYPDCSHAISEPVCDKVEYNIGWVRLSVWLVVPILISLALMLCIFATTSHHQNKRLDEQVKLRMKRSADLLVVNEEKNKAVEKHRRATMALDEQKKTEESRIDREARRRSILMFEEMKQVCACELGIHPCPLSRLLHPP